MGETEVFWCVGGDTVMWQWQGNMIDDGIGVKGGQGYGFILE